MKQLSIFKPDRLVCVLSYVGLPAATFYGFCMFILPWIQGSGDWTYVQDVWDRWQSVNVGMLALVSSITALNISRFNAENQRERDFLASKAFLPAALSELVIYFEASASLLKQGWKAEPGSKPGIELPPLPEEYKAVFGDCIRHASPDVGDYLSQILVWLQVHDSRMRGYASQGQENGHFSPQKHNLLNYFFRLGELQAMVNKLFDFARNMAKFDSSPLKWEDFHTAYANLDIWENEIEITGGLGLEEYTKRNIGDSANQNR
jgi:hypothetical protein